MGVAVGAAVGVAVGEAVGAAVGVAVGVAVARLVVTARSRSSSSSCAAEKIFIFFCWLVASSDSAGLLISISRAFGRLEIKLITKRRFSS